MGNRNKVIALCSCLLGSSFLTSCASVPAEMVNYLTPVQLNSAKDAYHEKRVKVRGWMRSEFENYGLWQSKAANEKGSFIKDCVSLMIPESMDGDLYNKQYVELEGVFLERLPSDVVHLGGCNLTTLQLIEGLPPVIVTPGDESNGAE